MASQRAKYQKALRKWSNLKSSGNFSLVPEEGITAILCSQEPHAVMYEGDPDEVQQIENFQREGRDYFRVLGYLGRKAYLEESLNYSVVSEALDDRRVTDIVIIGHGTFSSVYDDSESGRQWLDWYDISLATTHLKRGSFTQRTCGNLCFDLSVPLGLFAMTSAQNVYAPVGEYFSPETLGEREEDKIKPVGTVDMYSYADIKRLFPTSGPALYTQSNLS
jgi:hypothetical protein